MRQCWPMISFLILFSKTCCTNPSMFEISLATFSFHHGCRVLSTCPILPRYFGTRETSPLIQLHATLLSPHECTEGPSPRMRTMVSAGSKYLGVLSLIFFPIPLLFFFLRSMFNGQFHFVKNKRDEFVLLLQCAFSSSCSHPIFFASPFRGDFIPHISSIVRSPLVWFSVFRFIILSSVVCATISYFSTCRLLEGVNHSIRFLITSPSHFSPNTLCNFSHREGKPICLHIFLSGHVARSGMEVGPCFFFMSFKTEQAYHCLGFPSFDLFHRLYDPRPIFNSKRKDCIDVVHQSLTLYPVAFVFQNRKPCLTTAFVLQWHRAFSLDDS